MLAVALERDVLEQNDLVVTADFLESARKMSRRILGIAEAVFLPGARHPRRRVQQALAVGIVAGPADERAHGILDFVRNPNLSARIVFIGPYQAAHFARGFLFALFTARANRPLERK